MALTRRDVLRSITAAGGAHLAAAHASAATPADPYAVLVDLATCIGCRKCEWACNRANHLPPAPVQSFEDPAVFSALRRPDATHYTVVNRFDVGGTGAVPVFAKVQCMHCTDPACCSACLVSALEKQPDGAVTYTPWKCMGCRYCMVVCPFQVPAYEFRNALNPRVRKCTFCHERVTQEGKLPACVEICPPQSLTFGRRSELLALAHRKIGDGERRYVDHVYGEHEVGGASWLYLSTVPFAELGLPVLDAKAPPRLTESLQHGLFSYALPPLALFTVLTAVMRLFPPPDDDAPQRERGRR